MKEMKTMILLGACLWLVPSTGYGARKPQSMTPSTTEEIQARRAINVRVNPLGLLVGAVSGDVDFTVSDKFTVGPSIGYFNAGILGTTLTGYGIGARANLYLTGDAMTDSWILGPNLGMSIFSISSGGSKASTVGFYVGSILGYQWVWKSGFNVNLGFGANYYTQGSTAKASDGTELAVPGFHGLGPSGELTVGWAF